MEKLVILDYSTNTVHIHNIDTDLEISDEYVDSIGYNISNCYYIAGDIEIIEHQGILL
jgi:hypothetical protein